jgi:hypothetical protein
MKWRPRSDAGVRQRSSRAEPGASAAQVILALLILGVVALVIVIAIRRVGL